MITNFEEMTCKILTNVLLTTRLEKLHFSVLKRDKMLIQDVF